MQASGQNIGYFSLQNEGGFVVAIEIEYWQAGGGAKTRVKASDYYPIGETRTANPGDYGVPNESLVSIYASVFWGTDNQSKDVYIYTDGLPVTASYTISGTTGDNSLGVTHVG